MSPDAALLVLLMRALGGGVDVEVRRRRNFASEANPAGKFVGSPPFGLVIVVFEARVELP